VRETGRGLLLVATVLALAIVLFPWPAGPRSSTCPVWPYSHTVSDGNEYCVSTVDFRNPSLWSGYPRCENATTPTESYYNDSTAFWGYRIQVENEVGCIPSPNETTITFGSSVNVTAANGTSTGSFTVSPLWYPIPASPASFLFHTDLMYPVFGGSVVVSIEWGRSPMLQGWVEVGH
jgi:hypothetical protein